MVTQVFELCIVSGPKTLKISRGVIQMKGSQVWPGLLLAATVRWVINEDGRWEMRMFYLEIQMWRLQSVDLAPQLSEARERLRCSDISLQITFFHCSTRQLWWVIQMSFLTWAFWNARESVLCDNCLSYWESCVPGLFGRFGGGSS